MPTIKCWSTICLAAVIHLGLVGQAVAQEPLSAQDEAGSAEFARKIVELAKLRDAFYRERAAQAEARVTARRRPGPPKDWRVEVDNAWGPGQPTERKLQIFDAFWKAIDEEYASFQGLEVDWAALRDRYRPEVADGVSRGRFAAIMSYMALELRDSHVHPLDLATWWGPLLPGFPLLGVGQWFANNSGTCGTAYPDGSTLLYSVVPDHPLGLEAGDRVLGFDGRPWRRNVRDLLRVQLPLSPIWWGSSRSSFEDTFTAVANINWHLFTTIDVLKHKTHKVQHLSTAPLLAEPYSETCSEQMDIPGIPKPDIFNGDEVSWGVLPGTRIGYIYVWAWDDPVGAEFTQAVEELTQNRQTDGLIIDHRLDLGGYLRADDDGLDILFRGQPKFYGLDVRANRFDHLRMRLATPPSYSRIGVRDGVHDKRFYDRPIAVLSGPGAVSMGDHAILRLSGHPRARTFGKPASSAFGPIKPVDVDPEWEIRYPFLDAWPVGDRHDYLTREELPPDEAVWLRPKDVARGRDTVVQAAVAWISRSP